MDTVQPQPPPPPKSYVGISYLFAVIAVTLFGVAGVLGILYFVPGSEATQLILALIAFCSVSLTQLVNFIKISDVKSTTQETHLLVNSQMAELKKTIAELEFAKGITEGISQQREIAKAMKIETALDKEREDRTRLDPAVVVRLPDTPRADVVAIPVKKTRPPRRDR